MYCKGQTVGVTKIKTAPHNNREKCDEDTMSKQIIDRHEQDLALLKNKLQLPLIARDYLSENEAPASESRYALHEIMSNLQPQDALLCAAFILKEIASFDSGMATTQSWLHRECDALIACYANKDHLNESDITLPVLVRDMENFTELLDLAFLSYDVLNPKAAELLDIIVTQMHAQVTIVETVLEMTEAAEHAPEHKLFAAAPINTGYMADNVVMFPTLN